MMMMIMIDGDDDDDDDVVVLLQTCRSSAVKLTAQLLQEKSFIFSA